MVVLRALPAAESRFLEEVAKGRFLPIRKLGSGSMGSVYHVLDRKRDAEVALKRLLNLEPDSIFRFKREFRSLAGVSHPNLVSLHELFSHHNHWCFTMELVRGVDFVTHLVGPDARIATPQGTGSIDMTMQTRPGTEEDTVADGGTDSGFLGAYVPMQVYEVRPLDYAQLRHVLIQLVEGIASLHGIGQLHRDVKPSNVMVEPSGRLVLLDFGVITPRSSPEKWTSESTRVAAGTPAYMAPELMGQENRAVEASDWFSVGVMLYEVLTGRRPFGAGSSGSERIRQLGWLAPPSDFRNNIPADLSSLCMRLLNPDPAARPVLSEILSRLRGDETPTMPVPVMGGQTLVGRAQQLAALRTACHAVQRGEPRLVLVRGKSGMGKTALVREFLDEIARDRNAVVFHGRCFQHETVPYKTFDSLIDSITRYLMSLSFHAADALLPRDILILARMFPVLSRVDAIAELPAKSINVADPQELRRRAFAALRELLARIAQRRLVVTCIDDLQWGDLESVPLMSALLRPPDVPPMLMIGCYRQEDEAVSPPLRELVGAHATERIPATMVDVDALEPSDRLALVRELMPETDPELERATAEESEGSPFLIRQLCSYAGRPGAGRSASLRDLVSDHLAGLPELTRKLMVLTSIAGRPLPIDIALAATRTTGEQCRTAITQLQSEGLLISHQGREGELFSPSHERIREIVIEEVSAPTIVRYHRRLARAIQASPSPDVEALVYHYEHAGQQDRAAEWALAAAEEANRSLAFKRAADLYARALDGDERSPAERNAILAKRADALVNAGHGAEAAEVYLEASRTTPGNSALELQRRAAEQFLHAGHFDRGLDSLRAVLAAIGLKIPPTPRRAIWWWLTQHAVLRVRGYRYELRDPAEVTDQARTRLDILHTAASGLGLIDSVFGLGFITRMLREALVVGEPLRLSRAMALACVSRATQGRKSRALAQRHYDEATRLSRLADSPAAVGWSQVAGGILAFLNGEWRQAWERCRDAEVVLREQCTGVSWELSTANFFGLGALYYLGRYDELSHLVEIKLRQAEESGDLYAATGLRSWRTNAAWLASDQPDVAQAQVDRAAREWSTAGFHLQHYYELVARCQIDLYRGQPRAAYDRLQASWKPMRRSFILVVQNVRIEAHHLLARCAVATRLAEGSAADDLLKVAARCARVLHRERTAWAGAVATMTDAAIARARGDTPGAASVLAAASARLVAADMPAHADACAYFAARLIGDTTAEARARERLTDAGIANAPRFAHLLVPGFEHQIGGVPPP